LFFSEVDMSASNSRIQTSPTTKTAPAILFNPEGYEPGRPDLMGRLAANQSFLKGLIRHGGLEALHCCTFHARHVEAFVKLARDLGASMPIRNIEPHRQDELAKLGGLFVTEPSLVIPAQQRSFAGHHAYALTGVTHTTADPLIMTVLAGLVTAPVQAWDAVVCTSRAVASMVEEMLRAEEAMLAQRLGARRFPRPMLPVIPLGIDADQFAPRPEWRAAWREQLGIQDGDVAALYVGRLSRHGKAHPLPLFATLGRAARRQPQRLHLILAGWWLHPPEEEKWREQAAALCPEVTLHFLDGREPAVRREIWSAADLFTMLVDNIQETFGLAPIEAMAAGLPVVATDWDGFRDTVRHGTDGILVSTLMAPAGAGREASRLFATGHITYGAWLTLAARQTAVDIRAATDAIEALAADPALRQRMGTAGRAHARTRFDWSAIIPQYQALWQEQQSRCRAATSEAGPGLPVPDARHMDPHQACAAWPTRSFHLSQRLRPDPNSAVSDLSTLLAFTSPALPDELEEDGIAMLLTELQCRGEATAEELLRVLDPARNSAGQRALVWLLRVGLASTV
jgi:alpha-maltose-1-phosphate synthase